MLGSCREKAKTELEVRRSLWAAFLEKGFEVSPAPRKHHPKLRNMEDRGHQRQQGGGEKERKQRREVVFSSIKEHPSSFSHIQPCSMVTVAQGQTQITFNLPLAYLYPTLNAQTNSKGLVSSWSC